MFSQKEVLKEKNVIFEEMKIYHDSPMNYVSEKINDILYEKPLAVPLIGTPRTVEAISRKDLLKKFKQVYRPNNLILCVVGNCDFLELIKFAEKNFGNQKSRISAPKIVLRNLIQEEKRRGIDQANLILAFHSPLFSDKKSYAAQVLMAIMGHGLSSRLFHEIREKRNLAYAIFGDLQCNKYFSYSYIYAGVLKKNIQKVKELILKEFKKVSKSLGAKEVEEAKEQLIGNYYISMEKTATQMHNLLLAEINSNAKSFYEFEKNIRSVKLKDVKELAKKVEKGYSFFTLVPD